MGHRCGARLTLPVKVFDINSGKYVHVFRCSCGQLIWDALAAQCGTPSLKPCSYRSKEHGVHVRVIS